ncbi:uncharacterized protein A4U43_C01F22150 [Asparagus officinalis]|uniref:FRIGIDA-like protein n=1 Tax=Asparagus officinalis TaxID=4686 RepID=A0A5P1FVL2_ASPOF|nr:uncharacterized protein A4U43_C01F22150 [Asparagus officinalis]
MATEALTPANQIQKTFNDLEAEKTLIDSCTFQWKTISDHFASLSRTLAERFRALDSKIQSLNSQTKETMASLNLREAAIPDRESAAAALIESKKESAIKEMENAESKTPSTKGEFLRLYCRRMDSSNLWKFMIAHRKDLSVLRREINEAIMESVDACRLVIDAVDDFLNQGESVESGGDRCWAIGMLLRALFDSEGRKGPEVSEKIRERAAEVAVEWRKKIGGKEEGGEMGAAEAQIFLQMVVAFGLSSRFEEEELRKLVLEHASRKEMAKLAAGLGLGEKMADIIDELIKTGKELEAVSFTSESGLIEKFSPTPLLKNYLHNSRKKASDIAKNGKNSAAALFWHGTLGEANIIFSSRHPKGEITTIVEGKEKSVAETPSESELEHELRSLVSNGHSISMLK